MSDAAANARAFSEVVVTSEKDQPMIESGGWAVYEAIVRRKSRVAIWRDRGPQARGRTHERTPPAEISACARRDSKSRPRERGRDFS
jgi:hypothetical protein